MLARTGSKRHLCGRGGCRRKLEFRSRLEERWHRYLAGQWGPCTTLNHSLFTPPAAAESPASLALRRFANICTEYGPDYK